MSSTVGAPPPTSVSNCTDTGAGGMPKVGGPPRRQSGCSTILRAVPDPTSPTAFFPALRRHASNGRAVVRLQDDGSCTSVFDGPTVSSVYELRRRAGKSHAPRPVSIGMLQPKFTTARRLVATLGALGGAVCMRSWNDLSLPAALWLPTLLLASSAILVWRRHIGGQLLARAVWWSNLILGTLIATSGSSSERGLAAVLSLCTGGALIAVGRADLDEATPSGSFLPTAFRGTLICLLVMAMADAQSLLLFGVLELSDHRHHHLAPLLHEALPIAVALPLLVSVIGLYRLRLWGLLLCLAASLALALLALTGTFDLPSPLLVAYVATAAAQWLVALPLVVALIRHRAPTVRPSLQKHSFSLTTLVIATMVTLSLTCAFVLHTRLLHV